jgi:[ribosomal protein S18]-alanine N-acetyltransferase
VAGVTVIIRPMARSDIPAVAELEAEIYPQPWSPRVFFDELAMNSRSYVVALDGGETVVGYGGLLLVEEDAHITTVAVDPRTRGKHIGTRLMVALVDSALDAGARHLTLEVRVTNAVAQGLYERFGFDPVGRRKNYYKDEDALVMWATDIDTTEYAERLGAIRSTLESHP